MKHQKVNMKKNIAYIAKNKNKKILIKLVLIFLYGNIKLNYYWWFDKTLHIS